jgi:hypothetical protein
MAINERVITGTTEAAAPSGGGTGNQEEGLILHLDANDVDSYDGDGSTWYDITDHEYTPAENPEEHFNSVIYTGDGNSSGRSITGVGFKPDLVWIKERGATGRHQWQDSVLGDGWFDTADTITYAPSQAHKDNRPVETFDSDGFTIPSNYTYNNGNNDTFVAWCFKAGGAPTATNTATSGAMTDNSVSIDGVLQTSYTPSGSPDTYPNKMSVNNKLGFSIVNYDASLTAVASAPGHSIPHGLNNPPEMIIWKNAEATHQWRVAHGGTGGFATLGIFDTNAAFTNYETAYPMAKPTADVFYTNWITGIQHVAGQEIQAYCFHSVRGVSKVGSYTGTGAAGNKVYTGFEPAWVMIKNADSAGAWNIMDNKRDTDNPREKNLWADTGDTEATASQSNVYDVDFDRDGFTIQNHYNPFNKDGDTIIYLAFAKNTKETELTPNKGDFTEGTVKTGAELELDANDYSGTGNWLNTGDSDGDGVINGATYTNDGTSDYFTFDGSNDYVSIEDSTDNDYGLPSHTGTIEAWINIDSLSSENPIVNKRDTGNPGNRHFIFAVPTDGNVDFIAYNSDTDSQTVTSNTSLSTGRWYHVAVTLSTDNISIYIDGELDAQAGATYSTIQDDGADLDIGRRGTNSGYNYFDGKIAQVRIYDTQLTSSEIKANYDATYGLYQYADLKVHLDAGDTNSYSGSGSTWSDLANSNDATITGASYDEELGDFFDFGDDLDELSWSATTSLGTNRTAEMWVNFDNFDTQYLFDATPHYQPQNSFGVYALYVNGSDIIGNSDKWNGSTYAAIKVANPMTVGKWHHVVYTVDGSTNKIYIDGEEQSRVTDSYYIDRAAVSVSLNNLVFGNIRDTANAHAGGTYSFNGKLGQFRIYNSTLTEAQIRQNYNFTKNDYPNGYNAVTSTSYAPTFSTNHFDFDTTSGTAGDRFQINPPPFPSTSSTVNERVRSISLWARRNSTSASTFGTLYHSSGKIELNYNVTDDRMEVWKWINGKAAHLSGTSNLSRGNGSTSINTDWHHYVFIMTGTGNNDYKLYIDKVEETLTKSITSTQGYTYSGSYIGSRPAYQGTHYQHFDGDISDVKVFDKILTTEEITAEYNKGQFGNN